MHTRREGNRVVDWSANMVVGKQGEVTITNVLKYVEEERGWEDVPMLISNLYFLRWDPLATPHILHNLLTTHHCRE
jgi:hypothetical protein